MGGGGGGDDDGGEGRLFGHGVEGEVERGGDEGVVQPAGEAVDARAGTLGGLALGRHYWGVGCW